MVLFLMPIKSKDTDYLQKKQSKNDPQKRAKKEKEETSYEISSLVSGCGGRDSNSHRITPTTPSK